MAPIKKGTRNEPATRKPTFKATFRNTPKPTREDGKISNYFRVIPKEPPVPADTTAARVDEHQAPSDIGVLGEKATTVTAVEAESNSSNTIDGYEQEAESGTESEGEVAIVNYQHNTQFSSDNLENWISVLYRETHYENEVSRVLQNRQEEILNEIGNNGSAAYEGPTPPVYIRGEYTLYSETYVRKAPPSPSMWTEKTSREWRTGTLRLGHRWGDGIVPGGQLNVGLCKQLMCFAYEDPECERIQTCTAHWCEDDRMTEVTIIFVGGTYLVLEIPTTALGGEAVMFYGILDRTEEEMAECWPGMPEWKPQPYYETEYNPTLAQGRTRYLASTPPSGQGVSDL